MTQGDADLHQVLREVADGHTSYRALVAQLLRRGWLVPQGLYNVAVTPCGHFALAGVVEGQMVRVTASHRIPQWHGLEGIVESISDSNIDAVLYDQYGYEEDRRVLVTCVSVRINERPGTYCFWLRQGETVSPLEEA